MRQDDPIHPRQLPRAGHGHPESSTPPDGRQEVLLLAPVCRDEIVDRAGSHLRAGGAGLYASWALARLGARVRLHTPLARGDQDLLQALPAGVEVTVHPSRETTRFRIEADRNDPNRRRITLLAASGPLDPERIGPFGSVAYVLLGPLLPGDAGRELLDLLCASDRPLDVGIQGLVRVVAADGTISLRGPLRTAPLPRLRVLAGDEQEINVLAGERDLGAALAGLATGQAGSGQPTPTGGGQMVAEEIVATRGDRGAWIWLRGATVPIDVPAVPARGAARAAVGLGDTFLAVYGWNRGCGIAPELAASRAAAASSELIGRGYPSR